MTARVTLPVYETFYAWQGEGAHMGRAAFFVRTFGCPVHCAWCDSAGTWHPEWIPEKIDRITVDDLADAAVATSAEFVVVTGGEPAIHDLAPLTAALAERSLPVHLETSGGFAIRGEFAWVTVSPKWQRLPLTENVRRANEIKLIVEDESSIERWWTEIGSEVRADQVWLHPEWSRHKDPRVLNSISEAVKRRGRPFRAGFQLHRLYNVDGLDARSKPHVPLGGRMEFT